MFRRIGWPARHSANPDSFWPGGQRFVEFQTQFTRRLTTILFDLGTCLLETDERDGYMAFWTSIAVRSIAALARRPRICAIRGDSPRLRARIISVDGRSTRACSNRAGRSSDTCLP